MKGIAPIIAVAIVAIVIATAVGGYYITNPPEVQQTVQEVSYTQSQEVIDTNGKESIGILDEGSPTTMSIIGDRDEIFNIWCDNEQSYGLINQEYICHIKNNHANVQTTTVSTLLSPTANTELGEVYYKDTCSREECDWINTPKEIETVDDNLKPNGTSIIDDWTCSPKTVYYTCWKDLNIGLPTTSVDKNYTTSSISISSGETKDLKIIMKSPIGTNGKFSIMADSKDGSGYLDPRYNSDYDYRNEININMNGISENLFNFPTLIHLNSSRVTMTNINADGSDLRFTDSDGTTELPFEIEKINTTDAFVWVKVPFLEKNDATNSIYVYYGNALATNTINSTDVWSNNYTSVYHLSNDTANYADSSGFVGLGVRTAVSNISNGTVANAAFLVAKKDISTNVITIAHDADLNGMKTLEVVFRPNSTWTSTAPDDHTAVISKYSGGGGWFIERNDAIGTISTRIDGGAGVTLTTAIAEWSPDNWYWAGTTNTSQEVIYINGTQYMSQANGIDWKDSVNNILVGREGTDNEMSGMVDELRTSKVTRSTYWINATYYSMYNDILNTTFITYGDVEENTIGNGTINNQTYSPNIYEVSTTYHDLNVTYDNDTSFNASLWWNGNQVASQYATNTTPKDWFFSTNLIPNLTDSNGAPVSFYWNLTSYLADGTVIYNITSGEYTQNLYWSYYFNTSTANISTGYSADPFEWYANLVQGNVSGTVYNTSGNFNGAAVSSTAVGSVYYSESTLPAVATPTSYDATHSLTVTYNGIVSHRTGGAASLTAGVVNLTDCSDGVPIYRFDIYNEENETAMNGDFDATFRVFTDYPNTFTTYNFTFVGNYSHFICMNPATTSITIDADIEYANSSMLFPERYYFLRGATASNVTQTVNLYLSNSTYAQNIQFYVINNGGLPQEDKLINIQRYYEGGGYYRTVAMGTTDSNGYSNIRLRPYDTYYRPIVYNNQTVLKSFAPVIISTSQITLKIDSETIGDYWKYHDSISYECEFTNATGILRCDATDTSGNQHRYGLKVWEVLSTSNSDLCDVSQSGAAITLLCDVGDRTDRTVRYSFFVDYDNNRDVLEDGILEDTFTDGFAKYGLFFMLLMVVSLTFAGLYNPTVALTFALIGIIAGVALKMAAISTGSVVAIVLVLILTIYKVRT